MNTKKLRKDIAQKLDSWDERSMFSIAGVNRLTRSDIDVLLMCCDVFEKYGTLNGVAYLNPDTKSVLAKYGGVVE
ncbi:MAG: hypothetical protein Q4G33_14395 [bacterium]|nr:hypothetical protein [bacterium]